MKLATGAHNGGFFADYADSFRSVRSAGFRYIDFPFANFDKNAPESMEYMQAGWRDRMRGIRAQMEEADVEPIQAHAPFCYPMPEEASGPLMRAVGRTAECCALLGIDRLVAHPHAEKGMTREEFLEKNRRLFRSLIPVMEETGVSICIENIGTPRDPHFVRTGRELLDTIQAVGHPMVHACWDVGHANTNMEDQRESIRTLGKHLWCLHVHDNLGDLGDMPRQYFMDFHTLPYLGNVNYDAVLQALLEIGYEGHFTFETDVPRAGDSFRPVLAFPQENPARIMHAPRFMRERMNALLYDVGRYMLERYGCFEE